MSCRKFRKMMLLNREGELTAADAKELAEHLTVCTSCAKRGALAEVTALMRRLHDMPLEPSDPEDLTLRILSRVTAKTPL